MIKWPLKKKNDDHDGWRLETLGDFWKIAQWLETQKASGRQRQAMDLYYQHLTPILRKTIVEYDDCFVKLNDLAHGIYTTPDAARNTRLGLPPDFALLTAAQKVGDELMIQLDKLADGDPGKATAFWRNTIENFEQYRVFVTKLVQQFGNFELVAMSLPGTGDVTKNPMTQKLLDQMYRTSTRWIRLFELAMQIHQPRRSKTQIGFFDNHTNIADLLRQMINEYLIEADPARIAAATERARKLGRRPVRYRFWRPAETLRQLANVKYETGPGGQRIPKPQRQFLKMMLQDTPRIPIDKQRLEWAFKEVLNNSIAATSNISLVKGGFLAKPLPQHQDDPENHSASLAIRISSKIILRRNWPCFWKHDGFIEVTISDSGVGIDETDVDKVTLWAYSPRRAQSELAAQHLGDHAPEMREILIGGKGIGLPFAMTTIREHGGDLKLDSTLAQGTYVIIELPVVSPLEV